MNQAQCLFVSAFLVTFAFLVTVSYLITAKLAAAGYDISRIILIGIDSKHPVEYPMAVNTAYAQFIALALAIASSVFIYVKFAAKRAPILNPKEFQAFPLKEKIVVSPNTAIYRFALPRSDAVLGLPIGQHISISAEIDGKEITRSYTPTSSDDDLGSFDLLIKSYEKGNISRYVSSLKIGDKVKVRGPKGNFKYSPTLSRHIGMIAGGTGITPMLQIIRAALKNPADGTKLSIIYANVNVEDILLKRSLTSSPLNTPTVLLSTMSSTTPQRTGQVVLASSPRSTSKNIYPAPAMISKSSCVTSPSGPPPMMTAMKKHLAELSYPAPRAVSKLEDQVFLF
ncbi:NADH-cytochrome b5 reductase [Chiua virens]|nr:NADH-cytochrome b5 reductase [Chiua virens]